MPEFLKVEYNERKGHFAICEMNPENRTGRLSVVTSNITEDTGFIGSFIAYNKKSGFNADAVIKDLDNIYRRNFA